MFAELDQQRTDLPFSQLRFLKSECDRRAGSIQEIDPARPVNHGGPSIVPLEYLICLGERDETAGRRG